jgi:cell division protein FtsL
LTWSLALGSFTAVFVLALVFLCQYAVLVQNHYRVVTLRDHQRKLERERDLMQLELQALSSLERVESVATRRLKMVPPLHREVLDLRKIQVQKQVASTRR